MAEPRAAEAVSIWFGTPGECQCCGGSTRSVGEDGQRGPFEGDQRFCSEECFEDAMRFAERARREAASSWCPSCGFDRHEHADGCESAVRTGGGHRG